MFCFIAQKGIKGGSIVCEEFPEGFPETVSFTYMKKGGKTYIVKPDYPYDRLLRELYREAGLPYPFDFEGAQLQAENLSQLRRTLQSMMETVLREAGYKV